MIRTQPLFLNTLVFAALILTGCAGKPGVSNSDAKSSVTPMTPISPPASQATPSFADVTKAMNYREQGLKYRDEGRYQQAIATLQKSVTLDPRNLSGYVNLGWIQHLAGQDPEAIQTLQQAHQLDPTDVSALNALGIAYLTSGDLQAAVATHQQAAKLNPDDEIAYYNLSLAYERLKQYDKAIDTALQATRLEPNNPHPWVALAIARWDKGEKTAAQKAYQQAKELDSRYGSRSFLPYLKKAAFSPEQIQTAEQILEVRS